ncbi:POLR3A [Cordylochernes scorpioides]|uniref:DNA-directed RNA polymerase subunit n=1 Tax=Cordylochernes scorpioides TaxID=51811 RepID=A0ABY6JXX9_9ARAC|nr:POLR3A [Cordylochernes scorpioides]
MIADDWESLQAQYAMYINSDSPGIPAPMQPQKPFKGLVQRLKGKKGRFRGNLSGKRVDFSGRTVISPNPFLRINEVGVPIYMAKILSYPERVTKHNIHKLQQLVRNGPFTYPGANHIQYQNGQRKYLGYGNREMEANKIRFGDLVDRQMADGDILLFNRQPSLHKLSLMAHRARVLPFRTLRFNECVCTPYNADFDGDEMNIHMPQTEEARAEALVLMESKANLVTPRNGEIIIGAIQDFITGAYHLTHKDTYYTWREAQLMVGLLLSTYGPGQGIQLPHPHILKPIPLWSGKQLFGLIIRPNPQCQVKINLETRTKMHSKQERMCPEDSIVVVRNSELLCGYMDKSLLGSGTKKGIFYVLLRDYGEDEAADAMWRLSTWMASYLSRAGFSIGIGDVTPGARLLEEKRKLLIKGYWECENYIERLKNNQLKAMPGFTEEETLESMLLKSLSDLRTAAGDTCFKELPHSNSLRVMAVSGSKALCEMWFDAGSLLNISQMIALVGQQAISGKRAPDGFLHRTLPHFLPFSEFLSFFFLISTQLYQGIKPVELVDGVCWGCVFFFLISTQSYQGIKFVELGIKFVELVDGVGWGYVFFLISTQSYQGIKLVELIEGVCWGCVFFLISIQSYLELVDGVGWGCVFFLISTQSYQGIKPVELVDGVCWGCVFFFLISTQSYQGIKSVELIVGVCWGCVFFLISIQSYLGIKLVEFVDGVCWGCVFFFLISTQSYQGIKSVELVDAKIPQAKGFVENSFYSGLLPTEFFFHTMGGREGLVDTAVKTADTGYMQRRLVKALEDVSCQYDNTIRTCSGEMVQCIFGDDGLNPEFMEGDSSLVDYSRLLAHVKAMYPCREESPLPAQEILHYRDVLLSQADFLLYTNPKIKKDLRFVIVAKEKRRSTAADDGKDRIVDNGMVCSDFFSELASKVEALWRKRDHYRSQNPQYPGSIMLPEWGKAFEEVHRVTHTQLDHFVDTYRTKYQKARLQEGNMSTICHGPVSQLLCPGTAIGAICAQSIGEPATQMTLKTFHFAGVASMSILDLCVMSLTPARHHPGCARIQEIINANKNISTPIITAQLPSPSSIEDAILVKGRLEKTLLSHICVSYEFCVVPSNSFLLLKFDMDLVKDLKLEVTVETIRTSILASLRQSEVQVVNSSTLAVSPSDKMVEKMGRVLALLNLKPQLSSVVIKGIPNISRAVVQRDDKTGQMSLIIEGEGLQSVISTPGRYCVLCPEGSDLQCSTGVEGCHTFSNNILEVARVLGIEAARLGKNWFLTGYGPSTLPLRRREKLEV